MWKEEKKSFPNKQVIVRTRTRVFFMLAWWVVHPEDDVLVFPELFSLPLPPFSNSVTKRQKVGLT